MSDEKPNVDVETVPGVVVQLPAGIIKDGKVYRDAEIIPMTGLTRKSLAREDVQSSPHKVTDVLILQCLRRIGPVTSPGKILGDLLVGDRDFLMLEIRRISMGDDINVTIECESCKKKIDVKFSIGELEIIRFADDAYEVRDGVRVFRIKSQNPKLDVLCRFATGEDQKAAASLLQKNPVEFIFKMYSRCVLEWDGKVGPFEPKFFEQLPVSVLDEFEKKFGSETPGPILRQSVPCPVCASGIDFTFQGSDFFFRQSKRGRE